MKLLIAAATAVSALALAAPASAAAEASLGYSAIAAGNVNVGDITGRVSWKFSDTFGIEGEASTGINDDTRSGVKVEVDKQAGIYLTAGAHVTDTFTALV